MLYDYIDLPMSENGRAGDMKEVVRHSSADIELYELLKKPSSELLGVSTTAATALNELGIETIFDLGTSNLFASKLGSSYPSSICRAMGSSLLLCMLSLRDTSL